MVEVEKPSNTRWTIIALVFMIYVLMFIDRVNISIAAKFIMPEYGLTELQFGWIFSAFVLGYALSQIPGGWLGDRFGPRRVMTWAIVWWSIFTAATALAGELILVEGDSAVGSAKQARDREFQAIMPLRGKIMNTWEIESTEILASQAVHDIAVALGVDPGTAKIDGLRYGKICILADADSDGLHIATLLCALFVKHFREIVEAGFVYVAMPPLFRIDVGKEIFYALDEAEKKGILDSIAAEKKAGKINVQRFKGLGEMNADQLWDTTMDPEARLLGQVGIEDAQKADELFNSLMGDDVEPRKIFIDENAKFVVNLDV